jgi:large subunit ribosomal protein L35
MPKQKTHKGLAKRVKITGTGKVKRKRCNSSHLMSAMNSRRRTRSGSSTTVASAKVARTIREALCK